MKRFVPSLLLSLCFFLSFGGNPTKKDVVTTTETFTPLISMVGPDMSTVIMNGDTSPDFIDGTMLPPVNVGESGMGMFFIQNTGPTDLNISSITFTGANASDFSVEAPSPTLVSAFGQEGLTVVFTPSSAGIATATINIVSDDPTNSPYTFALQGEAMAVGNALQFDGADDYVAVTPGTNLELSTDFTVSTWVNLQSFSSSGSVILTKSDGMTNGYEFFIDGSGTPTLNYYTASGLETATANTTLSLNQWYKLSFTYDGASIDFFVNQSLTNSVTESESILVSVDPARIGWDNAGTMGRAFNGMIDDLQVYNRVQTSCEIDASFGCQVQGFTNGLVAHYTFLNGLPAADNTVPFPVNFLPDVQFNLPTNDGTLMNFTLNGSTSNWVNGNNGNVSGTCATYLAPELSVDGLGLTIADGDDMPETIDGTDFGNADINGGSAQSVFTLMNAGSDDLNISDILITGTDAADFSVTTATALTVAASSSDDLIIAFAPTTLGTKTATVTITSDDCDGSYTFDIQGTGVIFGTGLNFDGSDDRIEVSHDSAFNVNTFTIEAYFKTTSTVAGQAIINKYDTTNINGFSLYLNSAGGLRFEYAVPNSESTSSSSASGLNDGNWHHVAVVFGGGKVLFYIDGALDNEITFSNIPDAPTNTESLYIGYSTFNNAYFNGDIDEVRYWSRTLCDDELSDVRACQLTGNESGLVANFPFNQGVDNEDNSMITTATDNSSNNFNGTLQNFALTGTTSNWKDTTDNNISGTCIIANPEINIQGNGLDIVSGDTTPNTDDNTDAGSVAVGNSAEMSFFVRNTDGTASLNVDGVFLSGDTGDFTITQNPSNNPIPATQSASLKIQFTPTSPGIKTAVVTVDSDDCDEPFYTFTIQGRGLGPATGLDFDGTDDFITVPHNSNQNSLNFSVDFWIKTTDGNGALINKFTPDGNNGWRINLDSGRIEFYYYASASNYTTRLLNGNTYVADGNWHHVAITLDSGNARCYIDGVSAHSQGWNGTATTASSTEDIQIGYAAADTPTGDAGGYFEGQLDELRVWTKTLSAFEVGAVNDCDMDMSQANLLLSYGFNQGISGQDNSSVTTLNDSSGNNTNGTLNNFALDGATSNWVDTTANGISGSCGCVVAGGVTLTTQTEVDNYINNTLGTCNIIEGNVTINGTITDLSGFANVHTISGDLYIEGDIVDDLSGFANLTTIGDDFTLRNMANTTSIASFSNVTSLGGNFIVDNLDLITEISILDQMTTMKNIEIGNNALLSTITFSQLQTMTGSFKITFNGALSSISVPQLTQTSGEVRVNNSNAGLTSIDFPLLQDCGNFLIADITGVTTINAPELASTSGRVSIGGCGSLTTVNFPKLTSIGNNFSIDNSPSLNSVTVTLLSTISGAAQFHDMAVTDLSFLSSVTSIGGNLALTEMTLLNNVQGMDNLTSLGGFNFTDCDLVTSLEGFSNLNITSLNSLNISNNELLTSLSNSFLESLTTVNTLNVVFNGALVEIDALQNITTITTNASSASFIRGNGSLQSVNLYALNNVTSDLTIRDQSSITSLCGLYDYVTTGNGSTTLTFAGSNPTDWDSVQDILDNCNAGITANAFLQGAALNPNTGEESLMRDDLRVAGHLPTTSPYTDGISCASSLFDITGDNAIVDWVWLELRDASDNTSIVASRSALLQRDGDIVHTDGVSPVYFSTATASDYYVVINHRNHLGTMSSATLSLSSTPLSINFTDGSTTTFGSNGQTTFGMPSGVSALWAGNANNDTEIVFLNTGAESVSVKQTVLDVSAVESPFGASVFYKPQGYYNDDVNMDGEVIFLNAGNELLYIKDNILAHPANQVFNSVFYKITQQLP